MKLIPSLEPIRPQLERVEGLLCETLAEVEESLISVLRHSLGGGKRLRPALVILTGQVFASSSEPFYSLAAAVDMLHTATLIHDDLLDEAPLRRGRETLHRVWPPGAAILAGDYLLGQAISLIAELGHPRIFKVFGETICALCAGEIGRMIVAEAEPSREEYHRSIEAKTASLLAASTEMAAILAGAGELQIAALRRFGREFGMAFQIVDDVLDFIGDEAQLGKPAGSDFRQGLITLPILCHLERAKDDDPVRTVLSGQRDEEHVRVAIEAVRSSGAIEASLVEARAYARRSQEALAALPDNASCQMLCSLAEYVVERKR